MSLASLTRSQSLSVNVNADHQIFFSMEPLRRIVVMGPYRESADCRKSPTAYNKHKAMSDPITIDTDVFTHLTQCIRAIKHPMC